MGRDPGSGPEAQLKLPPGFRFYPTDEELVVHYLCKRAASQPFAVPIIAEVDLYKFDPWDLPEKALLGEKEWYFFSPRDRKYPNGSRPNRAAGSGYWKATGTDKPISSFGGTQKVGVKKALVFYKGRAPKGVKTNWIMHEYRLADSGSKSTKKKGSLRLDDWVLCRIYKKTSSAQKAARENSESSCLDEVLASLPDIDDTKLMNLPGLSSLKGGAIEAQDVKPNVSAYSGMNQAGGNASRSAQYSGCSPATMLQSGNIGLSYNRAGVSQAGMETVGIGVLNTCSQECAQSSHGGSSCYNVPRLSTEESRQHSPVDSVEEDSAVESTFTSLPSFALAGHQTAGSYGQSEPFSFPFSFDGLPSPFSRLEPLGWGDGGYFTSLGSDYLQRPAS